MKYFITRTTIILLLLFVVSTALTQEQDKKFYRHQLQLGADLERLGQYEKALDLYLRLYRNAPQDHTVYLGAKRCLVQLGEFDRLEKLVRAAYKNTGRLEYQVDLGELFYRKGKEKKSFEHWEELIQQNSKRSNIYIHIGQTLTRLRLYDEAIKLYLRGRGNTGQNDLFIHELANLYIHRMDYELAAEEYVRYLLKNPRQISYVESRIASFARSPDVVEKIFGVFENAKNKNEQLSKPFHQLMAGLFLRNRNYARAFEHYRFLEDWAEIEPQTSGKNKESRQGNHLYSFAKAAQSDGAYEYAKQTFDLIVTNYPKSPFAITSQFEAAHCLESLGAKEKAIAAYELFVQKHPQVKEAAEAKFRIAEIYFSGLNNLEHAKEAYSDIVKIYPRSKVKYDALFRLGDCSLILGDLKEAEKTFQKIISELENKKGGAFELALLKKAQLFYYQGQFDKATKLLDEIVKVAAPLSDARTSKSVNDALELGILIGDNLDEKEALTHFAKSQLFILQRKPDSAQVLLESLVSNYNESSIYDEALMALGAAQRDVGDFHAALTTFNRIISMTDENVYKDQAQWQIAEIYETDLMDISRAQKAYEELLEKYPQSILLEEARRKARKIEREIKTET